MSTARILTRATRAQAPLRSSLYNTTQRRFASTEPVTGSTTSSVSQSANNTAKGNSQAIIGGLIGGGLVFLGGYSYYHYSGASTLVSGLHSTKSEFQNLTNKLSSKAPEPNEALNWLRQTATSYATFIPGGKSYVDSTFDGLDKVVESHGKEVEDIVNKAYNEIKKIGQDEGVSIKAAVLTWGVLEQAIKDVGSLSGDAILEGFPELKEKFGGSVEQLRNMASGLGDEGKKEVEGLIGKIKDVVKSGKGDKVEEVKKIVEDAKKKFKGLGEQAYKKGLEKAKPYLDKNPEVKKVVEENEDVLKSGDVGEAMKRISDALYKGDAKGLQEYVKQAGEKAKSKAEEKTGGLDFGGGLEGLAKMIPGGEEILPKIKKLQEIAKSHGDEAEKIMKGALKDVQDVLQKRTDEVESLAKKAGDDAKKEAK